MIATSVFLLMVCINPVSAEETDVICRGETLTITVRLLQNGSYGDPVPHQELEFFDQTYNILLGKTLTDSEGFASIDWYLPYTHSLGPTLINVTFRGNESLALSPCCQWTTITVFSSTKMEILIENEIVFPDDDIQLTVSLENDAQEAISNANITIFHNEIPLVYGITNATGQILFTINCNSTWADIGFNEITIVYERNMQEFNDGVSKLFDIEVRRIITTIESNEFPLNMISNDSYSIPIIATAAEVALPYISLTVSLDDIFISNIETNQFGNAQLILSIDERFSIGPHQLKIEYQGSFRYNSSQILIDFVIRSPVLFDITSPEYIEIGTVSNIMLKISDIFNRHIDTSSVTLIDLTTNAIIVQPIPFNQTHVNFSIQFESHRGTRTFLINITGNNFIFNSNYTFSIDIWLKPRLILTKSNIFGYASPNQIIALNIQIISNNESCINRTIAVYNSSNTLLAISRTDNYGLVAFSIASPSYEGEIQLSIIFIGNNSDYELSSSLYYSYIVSRLIPVDVKLLNYHVFTHLQELHIQIQIFGLNGSVLEDVQLNYEWLLYNYATTSSREGLVDIHLSVPSEPGSYLFSYEIPANNQLLPSRGSMIIVISSSDAFASQGVGVGGITTSICISLFLICLPLLRRHYLFG